MQIFFAIYSDITFIHFFYATAAFFYFIICIAGLNAKIYGTMNAAIARRDAFNAVYIGLDFAIADPA